MRANYGGEETKVEVSQSLKYWEEKRRGKERGEDHCRYGVNLGICRICYPEKASSLREGYFRKERLKEEGGKRIKVN